MYDDEIEDEGGNGAVIIPAVILTVIIVLIIAISVSVYAIS